MFRRIASAALALAAAWTLAACATDKPAPVPAKPIAEVPAVQAYLSYLDDDAPGASDRFYTMVDTVAKAVTTDSPTPFQDIAATPGLESFLAYAADETGTSVDMQRNGLACMVDNHLWTDDEDSAAYSKCLDAVEDTELDRIADEYGLDRDEIQDTYDGL